MEAGQRIDAHHHLWSLASGPYAWMRRHAGALNMGRIVRPCESPEFADILARNGIARSVLVQADPTDAETDHILDLAGAAPFVAGTVGWADVAAPEAPIRIGTLAAKPGLRGLRLWLLAHDDPDWINDPANARGLDAIEAHGLTVDALLRPPQIGALSRLVEARPDLRVVVCHAAKPEIAHWTAGDAAFRAWAEGLSLLAAQGCFAKLSGIVTELGDAWEAGTVRPYIEAVLSAFGPERVLWGSDWPVIDRAGGYEKWLGAIEAVAADLPGADRDSLFGGAARAFYGL